MIHHPLRRAWTLLAPAAVLLLTAGPCPGQGQGRIPRYVIGGGPVWYPNTSYGFYSNGFSAYGPPLPTYAPVPGVFGGADQRFFNPVATVPYRDALMERGFSSSMFQPPHGPKSLPLLFRRVPERKVVPPDVVESMSEVMAAAPAPAVLEVRVPEAAVVAIDRGATEQSGTSRVFRSPPLEPGKTYEYEVLARWKANDQEVTQMRVVTVEAGKEVVVDFTEPFPLAEALRR